MPRMPQVQSLNTTLSSGRYTIRPEEWAALRYELEVGTVETGAMRHAGEEIRPEPDMESNTPITPRLRRRGYAPYITGRTGTIAHVKSIINGYPKSSYLPYFLPRSNGGNWDVMFELSGNSAMYRYLGESKMPCIAGTTVEQVYFSRQPERTSNITVEEGLVWPSWGIPDRMDLNIIIVTRAVSVHTQVKRYLREYIQSEGIPLAVEDRLGFPRESFDPVSQKNKHITVRLINLFTALYDKGITFQFTSGMYPDSVNERYIATCDSLTSPFISGRYIADPARSEDIRNIINNY